MLFVCVFVQVCLCVLRNVCISLSVLTGVCMDVCVCSQVYVCGRELSYSIVLHPRITLTMRRLNCVFQK